MIPDNTETRKNGEMIRKKKRSFSDAKNCSVAKQCRNNLYSIFFSLYETKLSAKTFL